jgi:hypothetical protein
MEIYIDVWLDVKVAYDPKQTKQLLLLLLMKGKSGRSCSSNLETEEEIND